MLGRLRASVAGELATLQNAESIINELRIRRWSIGAQTLAAITIPLSLLLAFFGTNSADVDREASHLGRYWPVYASIGLLVGAVAFVVAILYFRDRHRIPRSGKASRYYQSP